MANDLRILIYGINYSPELTGIGKYSGEMAEWLASHGHEVRVVTAPPYYPEWRVAEGYSAWGYRREVHPLPDGITSHSTRLPNNASQVAGYNPPPQGGGDLLVWRCPVWVPRRPSGAKRLLHLASFALSSLPVMLRQIFWKPDVVMVIEPPLMCAPVALLVARLCGAKAWLHIQDFEVDAAFDMGILPPGRLRNWMLRVERILMRAFDCVSTISPKMLARVVEKGVDPVRAVLFPNWVDTEMIHPLDGVGALRAELGIAADRIVALYSGNMGEKQGLEVVLEAAKKLQAERNKGQVNFSEASPTPTLPRWEREAKKVEHEELAPCIFNLAPDVLFVLCGDGAARQRLMERYPDLPNVMWMPLQSLDRLNELLNMADIHLLPQREGVADLVMPSKLTGMLASGRPIIATAQPATQVASVVSRCGIVTMPGNVEELIQGVARLAIDADLRAEYGKKARMYALKNLDKQVILDCFEKDLKAAAAA